MLLSLMSYTFSQNNYLAESKSEEPLILRNIGIVSHLADSIKVGIIFRQQELETMEKMGILFQGMVLAYTYVVQIIEELICDQDDV